MKLFVLMFILFCASSMAGLVVEGVWFLVDRWRKVRKL